MKIFAALCIIVAFASADVRDLGTWGETYEIEEPDILSIIMSKKRDFNATKIKKDAILSIKSSLLAKSKISVCAKNRTRVVDPTVILNKDIVLPNGKILYKKGDKINPLKKMSFGRYILFIDGTDPVQQEMAKLYKNSYIVLTKGDIGKFYKTTGIYAYSTNSLMEEKFDLKCVPSIYIQKKDKFKVLEYNPEILKN